MVFSIVAVCTGNICRSPQVEYVLRAKIQQAATSLPFAIAISSCGIEGHEGWPADRRSIAVALSSGYDIKAHRARAIDTEDYSSGILLALDSGHLLSLQRAGAKDRSRLLMDFAVPHAPNVDVPDPYYASDPEEFDVVLRMIERGCDGFVSALNSCVKRGTGPKQLTQALMGDLGGLRSE